MSFTAVWERKVLLHAFVERCLPASLHQSKNTVVTAAYASNA